jgi:hypothetical protein
VGRDRQDEDMQVGIGRVFFGMAVGMASLQLVAGCGSASNASKANGGSPGDADSGGPNDSAGVGADAGASSFGGSGGTAGKAGLGGQPGSESGGVRAGGTGGNISAKGGGTSTGGTSIGGAFSGGAFSGGTSTGGAFTGGMGTGGSMSPGCATGVPCTCDDDLVGVTTCKNDESSCSCPPASECRQEPAAPCFEPCGGEPFGVWVFEDSCLSGAVDTGNCQLSPSGTATDEMRFTLGIFDGGDLELRGQEAWSIETQVSLGCLGIKSVDSCELASYWPNALLFSSARDSACKANDCGFCDCAGEQSEYISSAGVSNWSRAGNQLTLASLTVAYCVKDDEMWLGGGDSDGSRKVAYKFKKQSCTGTPVPCSGRTEKECSQSSSCSMGYCKATSGSQAHCSAGYDDPSCSVLQGCAWDPDTCSGTASATCDFDNCDTELGCKWGPPKAKCGGTATPCAYYPTEQCDDVEGCSVRSCVTDSNAPTDCTVLTAADCAKAPGCVVSGEGAAASCKGQALCSAQTDTTVCSKLGCFAQPNCFGSRAACSTLSVDDCQSVAGCRIEW